MRTVTETIQVYKFSELSEAAKDEARRPLQETEGYPHSRDAFASLEKLAEHFDCRLVDYSVDFFDCSYSSAEFDCPDMEADEIEARLNQLGGYNPKTLRGLGDCKLTGYFMDEEAIDGFRQSWADGERELPKLMEAAFRSWLKAAQSDCEDYYSDEQFSEMSDANDWEYTADGEMY